MKGTIRSVLLVAALAAVAPVFADNDGQDRASSLVSTDVKSRQAWQRAVEKEERLPDWVLNLSGTSSPMTAVTEDGDKYLVGQVCETPGDCLHNRVIVAFNWDKTRAYSLWVKVPAKLPEGKDPSKHADYRWLGSPSEGLKSMLMEQLKNDPKWY